MAPVTVGKRYCLRLADGRSLGHVWIKREEEGWAEGPFTPGPAFEAVRGLFERETKLRHEQVIPLWEEAADAIAALGIQVIEDEQGTARPGLTVFVEGDTAILGAEPSPR
jgi:hypothetical protein